MVNWKSKKLIALYIFVGLIVLIGILGGSEETAPESSSEVKPTENQNNQQVPEVKVEELSTDTEIWDVFCNQESTKLQKQTVFDRNKDKLFLWRGELVSVSETGDEIEVKHCPTTLIRDFTVKMKQGQTEKLVKLSEGDIINYQVRLVKYSPNAVVSTELEGVEGEIK